jgi:hypothetical protein
VGSVTDATATSNRVTAKTAAELTELAIRLQSLTQLVAAGSHMNPVMQTQPPVASLTPVDELIAVQSITQSNSVEFHISPAVRHVH